MNEGDNRRGGPALGVEIVRVRKKRRKHQKPKRGFLIVVSVVAVLAGSVAACGAWYAGSLADSMAMDDRARSRLEEVLATASDVRAQPFYALLVGSDSWETCGERSDALARMRTAYDTDAGRDATRQSNVRAMSVALIENMLPSLPTIRRMGMVCAAPGSSQAASGR